MKIKFEVNFLNFAKSNLKYMYLEAKGGDAVLKTLILAFKMAGERPVK
jgi:hypothetical protein